MLCAEFFEIVIDCVYAENEWTEWGAEETERTNEAGERVQFENGIPLVCLSRNGYDDSSRSMTCTVCVFRHTSENKKEAIERELDCHP